MRELRQWSRSQNGRRKLRYAAASIVSAAIGQMLLVLAFGEFRWSARNASLFAFGAGAISSYHLNRMWVWGRVGRSDLLREVVPFWVVAAAGLAISTMTIVVAEHRAALASQSHAVRTAVVMAASCTSVIVVWLVKFLILDRYVFARRTVVTDPYAGEQQGGDLGRATVVRQLGPGGVDN